MPGRYSAASNIDLVLDIYPIKVLAYSLVIHLKAYYTVHSYESEKCKSEPANGGLNLFSTPTLSAAFKTLSWLTATFNT